MLLRNRREFLVNKNLSLFHFYLYVLQDFGVGKFLVDILLKPIVLEKKIFDR